MLRDVTNTALRYGTFWPGALAQDVYRMNKRRRSTQGARKAKRMRMSSRVAYRPRLRKKMPMRKSSKFARWNKNKRSIPNVRINPGRFFRYNQTLSGTPGATLVFQCLTDIPSASRIQQNIRLKSFDIDMRFMPVTGCIQPTFVRFMLVVQTGTFINPSSTELLGGTSHTDNFINMNTDREGWENRSYPINSLYKVIFAKTLAMAPLLEAGATSVQSNLNAQCAIRQRVKYSKYTQYDDALDNVPLTNNVYMLYWFDDDFRNALSASTTTHRAMGFIKTNYTNVEL